RIAPGDPRDAARVRQPRRPESQGHGARFAHQPRRPRLPGRADPQLHPGFDHGLYHRPRHVFRHGPGADRADAAARGIGRPLADDTRLTAMLFGFQWDTQNGELAFAISILPMLLVGLWVTIQATI